MKRLSLLAMFIAMVLSASAQYYMHVWSDGATYSMPVLNVDSVTFTDGPLENVPNEPQEPAQGIGVFSVGEGRTITFAPGNLQYHPANKKWRFAEHQWDCVGEANSNISETYDGWIDLFGWGTGNNPTNISTDTVNDYSIFTDWGSNQIGADMANTWHTISYDDWYFIFILRENATSLFGLGSINGVQGAIILPDNWIKPENVDFISANEKGLTWHGWYYNIPNNDGYTHNIYTIEQWTIMELAGAVFLPATGKRNQIAAYGLYWSSNAVWNHFASSLNFTESSLAPQAYLARNHGLSVRLIKDTIIPSIPEEPETPIAGIGVFSVGEGKTVTFSPGNLQYHPANDEWRFAENQWNYVGEANSNIAADYDGWLDLFGWGTGDCPTKASEDYTDYPTFVDWGTNAIGNDAPNTWRTLTMEEFAYIRYTRDNAAELIGIAQVNGVNGVILLPDNWSLPDGIVFKAGGHTEESSEAYALYQAFDSEQWSKMEALGAVFIPASGWRKGKNVGGVESCGCWWHSTSVIGNQGVLCTGGISIYSTGIVELCSTRAEAAYSVRLVKDLEEENIDPEQPGEGGEEPGEPDPGTPDTPEEPETPTAGIGVFSVGEGKTVAFSPGNLFFNATKGSHLRADGTTATGTWYFAENQWDYFGNSGLFGWGTSGYDNTKNDPMAVFYQPWNISYKSLTEVRKDSTLNCDSYEITGECEWDYTYFTSSEQNKNKYGYGPSLGMSDVNLVGSSAYYDWGMYNAISNGGDKTGSWRLLTEAEWDYLLNTRKNAQFLRSQATVNDVYGYVLLPDDFKKPSDITWSHQTNNWATNTYTVEQWRVLEAVGAIFLPAANYRRGTGQVLAKGGHYWSATVSGADRACYFYFNTENTGTSMYGERCDGRSVRLVKDL